MFKVTIHNNNINTEIHNEKEKLISGKVVKGINTIDSFSFSMLPSNPGFNQLHDFTTLIDVYNTNKKRYEFQGRVLYSCDSMDENGLIIKEVTCESFFGFMCDSQQEYVTEKNWTVAELLNQIIEVHNSQVEDYKHFVIGEITVEDHNDNLYCGIQRKNTWETIKEKLIDKLGGEIRFRVVENIIYLDYLIEIGETKSTEIALSRNMKSITKEKDPSAYVTRLIPLGCKLTKYDEEGNEYESEERLDISSVNDGKKYIDDEQAIAYYGLHVGYIEFDDVTNANILLTKGRNWLSENNKILIKYSITALDLSLLNLDIADFDVGNSHPIKNSLLGIDDIARINKKNIDICEEIKSTIEVGENFKTLSDLQAEQAEKLNLATNTLEKIESDYVTNEKLTNETKTLTSLISQSKSDIISSLSETYALKSEHDSFKQTTESSFRQTTTDMTMLFESITDSNGTRMKAWKYFKFNEDGITIGDDSSGITLTINTDGILFHKAGEALPFGKWDGTNFYTGNIYIETNKQARFGNYAFQPQSDGSLIFVKVGG